MWELWEIQARVLLAELLAEAGSSSEAEEVAREALRDLDRLSQGPLTLEPLACKSAAASCHRLLGDLLWAGGRREEAAVAYGKARDLLGQLSDPVAHLKLAWLLCSCPDPALRDPPRAVGLMEKATEMEAKVEDDRFRPEMSWNPDLLRAGDFLRTQAAARYATGDARGAREAAKEAASKYQIGGTAWDYFLLALAHQKLKLDEPVPARTYYDMGVGWMEKHRPGSEDLRRLRAEAAAALGIREPPPPGK